MDFRAIDHMTNTSNFFTTYSPCPSNKKIATTNGSMTTVAGVGNIQIPNQHPNNSNKCPSMSLNWPKTLSVHKLTQDLSCIIVFHHNFRTRIQGRCSLSPLFKGYNVSVNVLVVCWFSFDTLNKKLLFIPENKII